MSLRAVWFQAALDIACEIKQRACYARDGGIYWTQPGHEMPGPPRPLNSYLYPGTMGIALFFALASKVLQVQEYGRLALQAVEPLRLELRGIALDPERVQRIRLPLGGFAGLGSLIYGLVRLGDLLENPVLWDDALTLSMLVTPERISEEPPIEVMTGSAGALLALLTLEGRRPQANPLGHSPLDLALMAAEPLIRNRAFWVGGAHTAVKQVEPLSIGFCHGVSGIVYALARLARRTGKTSHVTLAQEGWKYVETAYDLRAQEWQLFHGGGNCGNSWCNGAAGILLAGIESRFCDSGALEPPLAGALRSLALSALDQHDHLCCGNMGRVDVLIHVAGRLQDSGILEAAQSLAMKVLQRAVSEGSPRLMFHPQNLIDLRLFPGLAGIGYTCLRLAAPEALPCALALA